MSGQDISSDVCLKDWLCQYIRYVSVAGFCDSENVARVTGQVIDAESHNGRPLPMLLSDVVAGLTRGATTAGEDLTPVAKGAILAVAATLQQADVELIPAIRQLAWKFIQLAIESGADPRQASLGVLRAVECLSARSLSVASTLNELVWEFSMVGCSLSHFG